MSVKRIVPGPGQESVWDYPRPPKLEEFWGHIRIIFDGEVIYDHNRAYRILETSHPPTYYLPIGAFADRAICPALGSSYCEFKGMASYYDVQSTRKLAQKAAWGYSDPSKPYQALLGHIAVYAHCVDACYVNDELVESQDGDFYGGWITSKVVGPFKGAPSTWGW